MSTVARYTRQIVEEKGWKPGSTLENQVALMLSRFRMRPRVGTYPKIGADELEQEYRIGKYRLDFAAPDVKIAIEVDGWHHRSPEGAARDAERDSWLRSEGWIVLRVDDRHGEESLLKQVVRAVRLIRLERR